MEYGIFSLYSLYHLPMVGLYFIYSLEELYLSGNAYEDITLDIPAYSMLRLLQLTRNQLSDWNHIVHLNKVFPGLVNLVLAENPISHCGIYILLLPRLELFTFKIRS